MLTQGTHPAHLPRLLLASAGCWHARVSVLFYLGLGRGSWESEAQSERQKTRLVSPTGLCSHLSSEGFAFTPFKFQKALRIQQIHNSVAEMPLGFLSVAELQREKCSGRET